MSFPRYESYKDSGVEWLGEVPEYWEVCALKRIAMLKSGDTINSDSIEEIGDFPVFGGNGLRGYTTSSTHEGIYALIGRQGALCGNINYAQGKFWASEHAVVVSPLNSVETYWLGELLRAMNLNQYSTSAAQPGLSVEIICNLLVPLPPLDEQSSIATFLSRETAKIDALITEQQRLIELLKEKRQSVISHAVTKGLNPNAPMKDSGIECLGKVPEHWEVCALRRLLSVPLANGIFKKKDDFGDGVLLVNVFDVYQNDFKIKFEQLDRVKCSPDEAITYQVLPEDLFFVRSSLKQEGIAAVVVAGISAEEVVFECHLIRARPKQSTVNSRYCSYLLNSPIYRAKMIAKAKITTMTTIDQETILSTILPQPPKEEQQTIAAFLDRETAKLDTFTAEAKTAITLLQERRTALISAAVTGKIDVRGLVSAKTEVQAETVPC